MIEKKILIEKYEEKEPSLNFIKFASNIFSNLDKEKWLWEYKNGPDGPGYTFTCKINNILAIHYSFIINKFKLNGTTITVAKSEGSYADSKVLSLLPENERRLFREVVKKALIHLKNDGIDVVYGFPNKNGHSSYKYGGYEVKKIPLYLSYAITNLKPLLKYKINKNYFILDIIIYFISFFWQSFISLYGRILFSSSKDILVLDKNGDILLKNFFNLYEKKFDKNIISIKRNWSYYQWRYFDNPYNKSYVAILKKNNSINGLIVLSENTGQGMKTLDIKDLITIDKSDVSLLLGWAVKFAIKKKVATLNLWSDKFSINHIKKTTFYKNSFFRYGKEAKKTLIISILNKKLKKNKIYFELRKYLERI